MKYMGSKSRIAKDIIPILIKDRKPGQYFVEPFCGSSSVIQEVNNPRIASDNNYYLIELLKWVQNGWTPPDIVTEEEYNQYKNLYKNFELEFKFTQNFNNNIVCAMIGFVGFCCSYGGKWWGGYARGDEKCKELLHNICGCDGRKDEPKSIGSFSICNFQASEIRKIKCRQIQPGLI